MADVWSATLNPGDSHLVLPDGCMDLVFRDGPDASLFWVGPMTRAELVAVDTPVHFLGIRFRPGVAPAFLGMEALALLDGDLVDRDTELLDALVRARCETARCDLLLAAVATRQLAHPDPTVLKAAGLIFEAGGGIRVADLARAVGVSERTLHRRFLASVGYGPRLLGRIARLGLARSLAIQGVAGADLAMGAGYFDQAHLCHEVASFGLTSAFVLR